MIGVTDDTGELVGIEPRAAEAQLWVKDTLRSHVLPLPPFRARWLPLPDSDERGILIVLVEASSTTPHLLIRKGAIYVRNPGSSDPVRPIADQRQLLDLTERGERSLDRAVLSANRKSLDLGRMQYELRLVPTGMAADFAIVRATPRLIEEAVWGDAAGPERREVEWAMQSVTVTRRFQNRMYYVFEEHVRLWQDGALVFGHGGDSYHDQVMIEDRLGNWFDEQLAKGREVLLDLGAHGDLRVYLEADLTNGLHADGKQGSRVDGSVGALGTAHWSSLDADDERDGLLRQTILDDFSRAVGMAPSR